MKKKGISKEWVIGIFAVIVLVGTYFGLNFLKNKNVFSGDYNLYTVFNQADGLTIGASVIVQGYAIGSIENITLNMYDKNLTVKLRVDGQYRLPNNSVAKIVSPTLLGGKSVELVVGTEGAPLLENGDTITASQERSLLDSAGDEYETLKDNLAEITEKANEALEGINRTLSEENTKALSATFANLESTTNRIERVARTQSANIEATLANLSKLSASLSEVAPDLERGVKNFAVISDSLKASAPELISSATQSVSDLQEILSRMNGGEGTLGKLSTDEELYVNLNAALDNLAILLEDLKANPKKYINVSVFGKN